MNLFRAVPVLAFANLKPSSRKAVGGVVKGSGRTDSTSDAYGGEAQKSTDTLPGHTKIQDFCGGAILFAYPRRLRVQDGGSATGPASSIPLLERHWLALFLNDNDL